MNKLIWLGLAGCLVAGAAGAAPNQGHGQLLDNQSRLKAIKAIAAVVAYDGTLIRAHAGTTVVLPDGTADGSYRVEFAKNVSGCVFTGVLGTTGSSGVVAPGYLTVAGDALSTDGVFVQTFNSSGTLTASSFHLLASC